MSANKNKALIIIKNIFILDGLMRNFWEVHMYVQKTFKVSCRYEAMRLKSYVPILYSRIRLKCF